MKKKSYLSLLLIVTISFCGRVFAQDDKFAYTVTDTVKTGARWNFLRKVDLRTGAFSDPLISLLTLDDVNPNPSLVNGVAAIALDSKNKRLYYTPLFTDRLSYVDLKTMKIKLVSNHFTGLMPKAADQGNIITRMVIGNDDYGYALTNDGKHLIRFNTKNNSINDLGALTDAPGNSVSVHELCSSYGGDIITADDEKLYLVTSRNHFYKINVQSMTARYEGTVSNLPENYISSGMAVYPGNNRVLIGSSVDGSDMYAINMKTLEASPMHFIHAWHLSDLATGDKLKNEKNEEKEERSLVDGSRFTQYHIQLYPNPVISHEFRIRFNNMDGGNYTIQVIDIMGQAVHTKALSNPGDKGNIFSVSLPSTVPGGIYIVKITDKENRVVFSEKIIVP